MARSWKRWTRDEDALLLQLKDEGLLRIEIVKRLDGRTIQGIDERYKTLRLRRGEKMRANGRPRKSLPSAIAQAAPDVGPHRAVSSSILAADQDLRSRISERGLTGGMFGDPAPGRSALDLKRLSTSQPTTGETHASNY
jgi:hypothetical protein